MNWKGRESIPSYPDVRYSIDICLERIRYWVQIGPNFFFKPEDAGLVLQTIGATYNTESS
jgi:hypothetical protein